MNIAELGVSTNPCSDTFCGDRAFSEVETANIRDYVLTISPVPTFGTAVHSAAELWLYPYGYDYNQFPDNVEEHVKQRVPNHVSQSYPDLKFALQIELGDAAVEAIFNTHGIVFVNENSASLCECEYT